MGKYIFSVVSSDWDTCIWWAENFRTAFQLLYNHLSELLKYNKMKKYSKECIEMDRKLYALGKRRWTLQRELSDNLKEMNDIFKWFKKQWHWPIQTICHHWYNEWWNKQKSYRR